MITLSTMIEYCLKAVAIVFLTLLCVPGLATNLGVDVAESATQVAALVCVLALVLPKVKQLAIPAYAKRALQARIKAQRAADKRP
jgi:hypothetical protein